MLHIYLDETFNLKRGTKNQFFALAGFSTRKPKETAKFFNRIKKSTLPKRLKNREIKSTDRLAGRLKSKLFESLPKTEIEIYAIRQAKELLPQEYFYKNKLDFDQLYFNILAHLIKNEWDFGENRIIIVILDSFKTKTMLKKIIIERLKNQLVQKYPNKEFLIAFESSATILNLQLADQIASIFQLNPEKQEKENWLKLIEKNLKKLVVNPLSEKSSY